MPDATIVTFNLEDKTPPELEARRRELILHMQQKFGGYDNDNIPEEMLRELAVITSTLRRKNAGPPKKEKAPTKSGPKTTINDLLA